MVKKMLVSKGVGITCLLFLVGCFPKVVPYQGNSAFIAENGVPDYASLDFWAAHPDKWDPSDSMHNILRHERGRKDIDVFFLYPTSYTDKLSSEQPRNARIDDPYINKKTDYTSILYQASVFNASCNVFAPRYRQAHISMYYTKDSGVARAAFDTAYNDVRSAFHTYLEKYNEGRPFIIASHSQGTTHATRLIKEEMDSALIRKMVTAYLVGMPVPKNAFFTTRMCEDSLSVGCFTSWRTYQRGYLNDYISLDDDRIAVVNPIHWKADSSIAAKREHKGAILYNYQKVYRETHDAQVRGNALFISKPKFFGSFMINMKNYHAGDYNLFYVNIREDVARRVKNYRMLHQQ